MRRIVDTKESNSYYEAETQPIWVEAMRKELQELEGNETSWKITSPPPGKKGYWMQVGV